MSSHNPLASMVSDKKSDVSIFEDPLYVTSQFFIADFTIPCLSTVWLCVSKRIFIKIPLMIWVPGMCGLISFIKFVRLQPLFLQIFLLALSYDSHYVYVGIPDDVPQVLGSIFFSPQIGRSQLTYLKVCQLFLLLSQISSWTSLSDLVFLYMGHILFPCMPCNFCWKLGICWTLCENSGNQILSFPSWVCCCCLLNFM